MVFLRFLVLSFVIQWLTACSDIQEDSKKVQELSYNNKAERVNPSSNGLADISKPKHSIYLSQYFNNNKTLPQSNFSCDDKVFAVMEFNNYPAKLHQIQIEWKDPFGQVREQNEFKYFITGAQDFAWSSLKLHRGTGAGLLQWINPAAGMEEFIGEWTVNVRVGDIIQETVKFEVLC